MIELKRSRVSIAEGIRQNLSNQKAEFNELFFATNQLVLAGNDSEGLRYGAIQTAEKYFHSWKEEEADNSHLKLDQYLLKICRKDRSIELVRDFVPFDGGRMKLPRVHQYFGNKAAQELVQQRRGGIIWHTQGSGKSIVMVLLAGWILANNPNARVVIITDRDELDKQIEAVFGAAGETIQRSSSGRELMQALNQPTPRLLCSLVHKFGVRDLFIFVDECHRTQSGMLHRVMKALLPDAVFIGFTGTPLLKKDKATSLEVFGGWIHTYKYSEGVEDQVVLDLVYEARDIDQRLSSQERVDQWFEAKTANLTPWQQRELKRQWGTMQTLLSSKARMNRIVADILHDFAVKQPRLVSQRGNAILVASSIYEACRYFELFQQTELKSKCAVITSYDPKAADVSKEEVGANTETDKQFIYNTYIRLLDAIAAQPGMSRTETYEELAKERFIKQPAQMKLLIVVDKLLTGFDAPSCSVLYIDKAMQDHGLFQAICRTNRLDGDDKPYGLIVDYKNLFSKVQDSIAVYSSDALDQSAAGVDPQVTLQDRLSKASERLELALEQEVLLAEPVAPPMDELAILHHFCGNTESHADLQEREPLRMAHNKAAAELLRAYAPLANELPEAGYSATESNRITRQRDKALDWRQVIRLAAGENLDLKAYEADMRYLIDAYIEADHSRKISAFDDIGLLALIVKSGVAQAIAQQFGKGASNRKAVQETIENNTRRTIINERANDPAFYDRMSQVLDEIISHQLQIGTLLVIVTHKPIKNLHLLVLPPHGSVRISAPEGMSSDHVRAYTIGKLGWIRRQQSTFASQPRESPRLVVERETQHLWGQRLLLLIQEVQAAPRVEVHPRRLVLFVRPQSSLQKRQSILAAWYREELRKEVWPLIETWQQRLHVRCNKLFIQAMSRQWGSCNPVTGNIRLNTQLAQKPKCCLDYIVLHELAHLRVPGHGEAFQALLNVHQPDWQERRALLNSLPLLTG